MADTFRQYDLVLLGATGYTGKLTAEYITKNLPTDLKWAIAGRNSKKLATIAVELKKLNPDRPEPAIEICELKKNELDVLARKTRLVITTVGPYMKYGEPVVEACANNGTHYLDCTGEAPWLKDMIEKYHETAKKNGAIMIPECGLDSVPADILSYAIAHHIRTTFSAPTSSVTVSMHDFKGGISGGTSATILTLFSYYTLRQIATALSPFSLSPVRPTSTNPPPTGPLLHRLLGIRRIPELGLLTDGPMAGVDTVIVHRSWGLYAQSPDPSAHYGAKFRFTEYMRARNILTGSLFHYSFLTISLLLMFPPTRLILIPLLQRFVFPAPGEGPAPDSTHADLVHYRAVGVSDTPEKQRISARFEWNGGVYVITGLTLAEAAMCILRGEMEDTEAGRLGGGMLTPACLGGEYVERLRRAGVRIEVRGEV
ncbi:hypothetical protein K432DRAFT_384955 [Lepidopterella palustris CBS 459.81]|uniref:Saccharopine dehydrogenase NADP binding domain-containing protein n=1 Tax=Lepidopterella palustris CBS 459.81 TaxID=1314670 RepID=A0A8E2JC93_9PEZI|nr:hypothetical protein K432DRAFT_384955 [Lepidopterella palustris CBS 459.81]